MRDDAIVIETVIKIVAAAEEPELVEVEEPAADEPAIEDEPMADEPVAAERMEREMENA